MIRRASPVTEISVESWMLNAIPRHFVDFKSRDNVFRARENTFLVNIQLTRDMQIVVDYISSSHNPKHFYIPVPF